LPITVDIGRCAREDDLAIGLERNRYRPFFRVGADRLANQATSPERPIHATAPVEPKNGDLAANSAADQDPTASLYCDAARCVVAAQRGESPSTLTKGWVERTGSRRHSNAYECGNQKSARDRFRHQQGGQPTSHSDVQEREQRDSSPRFTPAIRLRAGPSRS
jgi:hypothetical protein